MEFELGTLQDLVIVGGDLTLDGTLNVAALSGFGLGDYTLFTYGGSFVDNGVVLGSRPGGFNYQLVHDAGSSSFILTVSVPEPGSLTFLVAISVGLACRRRKSFLV